MAKTISDSKRAQTIHYLEKAVTPKIEAIVKEVNKFVKTKGVRVGLELNWFMDDITDEADNESIKKDT